TSAKHARRYRNAGSSLRRTRSRDASLFARHVRFRALGLAQEIVAGGKRSAGKKAPQLRVNWRQSLFLFGVGAAAGSKARIMGDRTRCARGIPDLRLHFRAADNRKTN